MNNYILEACVDSVESALSAERGGACRLELCSNLIIGGTTPSPALFKEIRKYSKIQIHALIRPRFGDFCYTASEFEIMRESVRTFRELGAEGVVIGILKPDGTLNMEQMRILMEEAGEMWVTLHRAFDVCVNPYEALIQVKELGIRAILTSGQKNKALAGCGLISELVNAGGEDPEILVGGGINAGVIKEIYDATRAHAYHMSGKEVLDSAMQYRKEGVSMGLTSLSEYEVWRTSEKAIREAVEVLEQL